MVPRYLGNGIHDVSRNQRFSQDAAMLAAAEASREKCCGELGEIDLDHGRSGSKGIQENRALHIKQYRHP